MRSLVLSLSALPLACYSPATKDGDSSSPSTSVSSTATDDGSSSSAGMTSLMTTTMPPTTSAESDPTSVDSSEGEAEVSSSGTGTSGESSSSTGDLPAVCGDGIFNPATELCDDGNEVPGDLCDASCQLEPITFAYSGASATFDVPAWVDTLRIETWGAQGGTALCCDGVSPDDGGLGGFAAGTFAGLGGSSLTINVGGLGVTAGAGGWNGGGAGGEYGAGGGGASDVRMGGELAGRIIVAGGGGGGNCGCPDHGTGGGGGGLDGEPGISLQGFVAPGGGSQIAGGTAGDMATAGQLGIGGSGAADSYHIAGGGGGYYGGGGGFASGAGGGSSYYGDAVDPDTMASVQAGDGLVVITPLASL